MFTDVTCRLLMGLVDLSESVVLILHGKKFDVGMAFLRLTLSMSRKRILKSIGESHAVAMAREGIFND